jgi:alcohol dehydrogenase class IV
LTQHSEVLRDLGKKALIVTGRNSAKANGALQDGLKALEANGQGYAVYDQVMQNPTVDCVFEGAALARQEACDWVLALGGGSPLDAGKAIAGLAPGRVSRESLFSTVFTEALPICAVPTTAGTGSEVTSNAVLTNPAGQNKMSIAGPALFPRIALLDARYTRTLGRVHTLNTGIDALSHAIEGMLARRASPISDAWAKESLRIIGKYLADLDSAELSLEARRDLLWASTLAGLVIANTGTIAVHAMGYRLTYCKNIDHGRANGLLLGSCLKRFEEKHPGRIREILACLGLGTLDSFCCLLDRLLGEREAFPFGDLEQFAETAGTAKNIANGLVPLGKADLLQIFKESVGKRSNSSDCPEG